MNMDTRNRIEKMVAPLCSRMYFGDRYTTVWAKTGQFAGWPIIIKDEAHAIQWAYHAGLTWVASPLWVKNRIRHINVQRNDFLARTFDYYPANK